MIEYDQRHLDIRRISESMKYGPEQFKEDWDTAIAISQLMGVHEPYPMQEWMLESCMNRVLAYLQNNLEERPWNDDAMGAQKNSTVCQKQVPGTGTDH